MLILGYFGIMASVAVGVLLVTALANVWHWWWDDGATLLWLRRAIIADGSVVLGIVGGVALALLPVVLFGVWFAGQVYPN